MKNFHTLLVERSVASMRQVEEAMARQVLYGGDLASHVLEQIGQDHEGALNLCMAEHHGLAAAEAGPLPLATTEASARLAPEVLGRHGVYPLRVDEQGGLVLVVPAPLAEGASAELGALGRAPLVLQVSSRIRIRQALARDGFVALDPRELRSLARIEGRPLPGPGSVPPPPPPAGPPSVRRMTVRLPAVKVSAELAPEVSPVAVSLPPQALVDASAPRQEASAAWPRGTKGLLRWMQRASRPGAPPRARRRRGPMPLGECEEGLNLATTAEEVLQTFFDFAQQYFVYSALFVVQSDLAEGRDAYGPGAEQERVAGIGIPLDLPSCLAQARNLGAPISVALRPDGIDASLATDLRRSPAGAVFVLPITVRQRCIALLYGDNGEEAAELADAAPVISAGSLAGGALERLALARKRKQRAEAGEPPVPGGRKATLAGMQAVSPLASAVSPTAQQRQQKKQALARALGLPSDLPRAAVPPPTLASAQLPPVEDSNPFRRLTASFRAPTLPPEPEEPIPATVASVPPELRPDAPQVSVGEASAEDDELVRSALRELMAEESPAPPRAAHPTGSRQTALPMISVLPEQELEKLLDQLVQAPGEIDTLLPSLLQAGVRVVPALMARLPGPLPQAEAMKAGSLRPSQAGPLLRVLVAIGKTALPFLIVQSGHRDPEARALATLLLGEFPFPEAIQALVPRFFDAEPAVAQAALSSARWLREHGEPFALLCGELGRISVAPGENQERRSRARQALDSLMF
ncbi:MAG: hypothetical protein MUF64_24340 [Polyangiaceae bacterium]|jgi:hypothetical protein|nr:hypothetical protein [Polyangiaceae bacterium]